MNLTRCLILFFALLTLPSMLFAQASAPPTVAAMSRGSGTQGATIEVTFTGSNFVPGITTLSISGTGVYAAGVRVDSSTSMAALLVLSGAAGQRSIQAVNPGGPSNALTLTVNPSPFATATEYFTNTAFGSIGGPGTADGIGTASRFYAPAGLWGDGNTLYISDGGNGTIRKMDLASKAVTTLAGTPGVYGSADGTPATFQVIEGIWGNANDLYVADLGNRTLRRVSRATGAVTTVAGSAGSPGTINGVGSAARFVGPGQLWGDGANVYITDSSESIRQIRKYNIATGEVSTLANLGAATSSALLGIWGDGTNLWVTDGGRNVILRIDPVTGTTTTFAGGSLVTGSADGPATQARFNRPLGIWGDGSSLFVSDSSNHTIRRVNVLSGDVTTIAGSAGASGYADGAGSARFDTPFAVWGIGNSLYVADYQNNTIRVVDKASGFVSTIAGMPTVSGSADGIGSSAEFSVPFSIWGNGSQLFITDSANGTVRRAVPATGAVTTVAGQPGPPASVDGTGTAARLSLPLGISGTINDLYFTELVDTVRSISLPDAQVRTLAGSAQSPSGSVDGTGSAARFRTPVALWTDGVNAYVTDTENRTIRRVVLATGEVTTFAGVAGVSGTTDAIGAAARFVLPEEIWGDGTNLYVADAHAIRRININSRQVTTIAGAITQSGTANGFATSARFNFPTGLWGDGTNLYVADSENSMIRKIDLSTLAVTTIAGSGLLGTDNGRASDATFALPADIWGDGSYLYVVDIKANNVRRIAVTGAAPLNTLSFSISDLGGLSQISSGNKPEITTGYGRILPDAGKTTPSGLAIFGVTQNGVLVSEAAVPASPLIRSGRIYAEIVSPVNTGVAIANPNSDAVTIDFSFADAAGTTFNPGSTVIPGNSQIAVFLDQSPFYVAGVSPRSPADARSLTFFASLPVSVVALRGLTNERGEFLITTLPVVALNATVTAPVVLPHFADGDGWTTQIVLVNPTETVQSGSVQFFSQGTTTTGGTPVTVTANGTIGTSFSYTIPAKSSFKFVTSGTPTSIQSGSVRVVAASGSLLPVSLGIFSLKKGGITVSEAGVPALPVSAAFRLYVEAAGNFGAGSSGSIQSGFAIANMGTTPTVVNLELMNLDGSPTQLRGTVTVPANGQIATFLDQVPGLQNILTPFRGILRVSGSNISVLGLRARYNQRVDFLITTTSPVNESGAPATEEYAFPHLADGGGYTTQLILFSGSPGATSGTVKFFDRNAEALSLEWR